MFDYYKLYELAQSSSGNLFPDKILYCILFFGILMIISAIIAFFVWDENKVAENTACFFIFGGIILCFTFLLFAGNNKKIKDNKKEFQKVIKEANIKTTPEKMLLEAEKLKSFCSYYYSEDDNFCSLDFYDEVNQRTFNTVFKRIYESKADENKDKVEKAFQYITK
jgi:hypothetical protein